ncbi:MAG: hypothetical protein IJ530_14950 [Treponema sp.]|uniref:hypothetical protein n=1 Tax=Treponema sp. TaxID=166 RepID=UPI0025E74BAE|nr:hypothetical protein [Treponema sp.]MBQ8681027.1 hypothetical protein [Treponema sp.]
MKIFNRDFLLSFTTLGEDNGITEKGLFKLSGILGQDIKDYLYSNYAKSNPELSHDELENWIKKILNGEEYIFSTSSMSCDTFRFGDEKFRVIYTDTDLDGIISVRAFKNAKNITLNLKENVFEINKKNDAIKKEDGTKLFYNNEMGFYYILAEIDEMRQPVLINFMSNLIVTRENTPESEIYEGEVLKNFVIKKLEKPFTREKDTKHLIKMKIGTAVYKFEAYKYNDVSIYYKTGSEIYSRLLSFYNCAGFPFFKDKCVQFDFENMMLYVW